MSGEISPFCFQPVGWRQSVGSAGALHPSGAKSFLLAIIPGPTPIFKTKLSSTNCEVPAGWESGSIAPLHSVVWVAVVSVGP